MPHACSSPSSHPACPCSSTPPTPCPRWCSASTTPSAAWTRSSTPRGAATSSGSRPSSPTPRPVSGCGGACGSLATPHAASPAPHGKCVGTLGCTHAGFGGNLNAYELMRSLIEAGAAAVHFEDQLASAKKCGHMGGKVRSGRAAGVNQQVCGGAKGAAVTLISRARLLALAAQVLVPTSEFIQKLTAARLAADVSDVPTLIIARTDALGAYLLTSDVDERDKPFCTGARDGRRTWAGSGGRASGRSAGGRAVLCLPAWGSAGACALWWWWRAGKRTSEGFFEVRGGIDSAIARGLAYAPYADLVWFETGEPNFEEAKKFAAAIHEKFPGAHAPMASCACKGRWVGGRHVGRAARPTGGEGTTVACATWAGLCAQASCWRTTARLRSTGRSCSRTRRLRRSSSGWARWASSSSSSRWRASTRSTTACLTWRTTTPAAVSPRGDAGWARAARALVAARAMDDAHAAG